MQIRLARIQQRLQEWATAHADRALWMGQSPPVADRPAESHVSFQMTRPPHWLPGRVGYGIEYFEFPTTHVSLTLNNPPVIGTRYGLQLNGVLYGTDAVGGDAATDIYDRLVTLIQDDPDLSVTPSNLGGELRIAPDSFGDVWQIAAFPSTAWTVDLNATDLGQLQSGLVMARVAVNVYTAKNTPRAGSGKLAAEMIGDLFTRAWDGLSILRIGEPQDLTAIIAGTDFESRTHFNVEIVTQAVDVKPIGYLEHITVNLDGVGTIVQT